MRYSDVTVSNVYTIRDTRFVDVAAYGGTRRQRGAAIAAATRGKGWRRFHVSYSETYGFGTATYARYYA